MFEQIKINHNMVSTAREWSTFNGNKFSIRRDADKMVAPNLAEMLFNLKHPQAERISDTDKHADFILEGKRVDVKCKERTVFCKDYYEVSVEARQIGFDVDEYVFYSYNCRKMVMEYLGRISKENYIKKSKLYRKGEVFDDNNWTVSVDCYNLKISELEK